MSRENESKYRKKKFPLLSCAMVIELMSTTILFAFPFVSHASLRCCAIFVDYLLSTSSNHESSDKGKRRYLIASVIFRYLQAFYDICRPLYISAGIFRYLLTSSDICRYEPPLNKIMTCHKEYTESLQAPPGTHEARRLFQSLA